MRAVLLLMLSLLWTTLPLQAFAVELRWNPNGIDKVVYKAAMEVDISGKLGELKPERWIADPSEFDETISRLKQLPLKEAYMHYRSRLQGRDDGRVIRAQLIGVPVDFEGEPMDEQEVELRELIDVFADTIRLQGDMDLSGDSANLTFYRSPRERNIMTQFFHLPRDDVAVGDHWQLPVTFFIELGPGVFEEDASTYNRVTLVALKRTSAGTVAELRYLVNDRVSGYVKRVADAPGEPLRFGVDATVFGYGEFLLEQGHWLRQVTVIDYAGSGYTKMHKQHLFALVLEDQ